MEDSVMDQKDIEYRRKVCKACRHNTLPYDLIMAACDKCGCAIEMITRVEYKECPLGKWLKEG